MVKQKKSVRQPEETLMQKLIDRIEFSKIRAHRKARAHYLASKSQDKLNVWFGVPIIIITTLVGSSIFVNTVEEFGKVWKISIGLASLGAAILSSLQTFFGFSKNSENHKNAGASYSVLYRELSNLKLKAEKDDASFDFIVDQLAQANEKWGKIEKDALDIPDRLYDKAVVEQKSDEEGH